MTEQIEITVARVTVSQQTGTTVLTGIDVAEIARTIPVEEYLLAVTANEEFGKILEYVRSVAKIQEGAR